MYVIQCMFDDGYNIQVKCKSMSEVEKWIHDIMDDACEGETINEKDYDKFVLTVAYI